MFRSASRGRLDPPPKGRERAGGSVFRGQLGRSAEGWSGRRVGRSAPEPGKEGDIGMSSAMRGFAGHPSWILCL